MSTVLEESGEAGAAEGAGVCQREEERSRWESGGDVTREDGMGCGRSDHCLREFDNASNGNTSASVRTSHTTQADRQTQLTAVPYFQGRTQVGRFYAEASQPAIHPRTSVVEKPAPSR